MEAFATAFELPLEHGLCVGVRIPDGDGEIPGSALAGLDPRERAWAARLPPLRRVAWIAGRLAMRRALAALDLPLQPLLPSAGGAPELPPGVAGSISHKAQLAVGLAGPRHAGELGLDLELDRPLDPRLGRRVLTVAECQQLERLERGAAARELLVRFALKEALYKALHPWLRRRIAFQEVEVAALADGRASVRLGLADAPAGLAAEARWRRHDEWVVATARTALAGVPGAQAPV